MPEGPFGPGFNPLEELVKSLVDGLEQTLGGGMGREPTAGARTPRLDRFGRDLTADARAGRLDPVVGRDDEIAQLVAKGLSNKDIANTLVISQRTADTHIHHIMVKLGFTSRTQVAMWIAEQDTARVDQPT